jgi:hypothetical protein
MDNLIKHYHTSLMQKASPQRLDDICFHGDVLLWQGKSACTADSKMPSFVFMQQYLSARDSKFSQRVKNI